MASRAESKFTATREVDAASHAQQDAKEQGLAAADPAGRQWAQCSAAHLSIPNPFHPLIEGGCTAGHQKGSDQRTNKPADFQRSARGQIVARGRGHQDEQIYFRLRERVVITEPGS